jgi:hypothetical protein
MGCGGRDAVVCACDRRATPVLKGSTDACNTSGSVAAGEAVRVQSPRRWCQVSFRFTDYAMMEYCR